MFLFDVKYIIHIILFFILGSVQGNLLIFSLFNPRCIGFQGSKFPFSIKIDLFHDLASSCSVAKLLFCKINKVFAVHGTAFAFLSYSVFRLKNLDTPPKWR
jgi:hypothetical protein